MKAKAVEIRWHDTQPVFSADFHSVPPEQHRKILHPYAKAALNAGLGTSADPPPTVEEDKMWRLATAGGDKNVRLWLVYPRPTPPPAPLVLVPSTSKLPTVPTPPADGGPRVEYLATLKQHTGVVNVVRWSPVGEILASAGDDGNILFWVPGESANQFGESAEDKAYEKESWRVKSMLRTKSGQEIYDVAWSPDGTYILAGSVDHTANIYDVSNGQLLHTIAEHTNYVQGVAWDPHNHFIATQSSDRSMHVYSIANQGGALEVHAVGKNSRMEVQHHARGSWRDPTSSDEKDKEASASKGMDVEVRFPPIPAHHRSVSQMSDSDRSEASSSRFSVAEPLPSPSTTLQPDESTSMNPPAAPRPSSRRSSTSGSHLSQSPALRPSSVHLHLRSPSPAPLPAVRVPLSPKPSPALVNDRTDTLKLYGDANSTPFFRRLCWSTDGSLLLTPAGLFEDPYGSIAKYAAESSSQKKKAAATPSARAPVAAADTTPKPTVYIYSRSNVSRPPIAHLPGHKTTSIAIRFCPVLWELRALRPVDDPEAKEDENPRVDFTKKTVEMRLPGDEVAPGKERPKSLFDLPYRMVYAVATLDCVFLYDTQQAGPICVFGNLHYAPFTDLSWTADGETLIVSSQDGYCSIIAFDPLELGTPYHETWARPPPPLPPPMPSSTAPTPIPPIFFAAAPPPQASTSSATASPSTVAPEKRAAVEEAEGTKKKKKKATLTFLGPIGGVSG